MKKSEHYQFEKYKQKKAKSRLVNAKYLIPNSSSYAF